MAIKFPFEKTHSPILGTIYRPVIKVLLNSLDREHWREVWMLIDTGADYTLLPRYLAEKLGVDVKKDCQIFQTSGIGGAEKVYFLPKIEIKLGDFKRNIPVGFLNRDEIPPLAGRHLFLETFKMLFSFNQEISFSL